jgi:FkbM family methyltransferase
MIKIRRSIRWRPWRKEAKETAAPAWHKVLSGPLGQHELFLAAGSPARWNREMMAGRYDSFMYDSLAELGVNLKSATVWDVGAHIGYHSLAFAVLAGPAGRVVAFEPNPFNRERFRMNLDRNPDLAPRLSLLDLALSDSQEEAEFQFSAEVDNGRSSGSHLDRVVPPENENAYRSFHHGRVQAVTADILIQKKLAPPPFMIKIDVEGAEFAVLQGSAELLASQKPLLFIEIHNITMMFKIQRLLYRCGYQMRMLETEHDSSSRGFFLAQHPGQKIADPAG